MALTTTQVNQAFLATLGRPAEGSAATWGSTSLSLGALSDSIFIAENTEDFVESLYTEILGRASDAEGKAFWNSLLATTSKEAVLAQFKAAVIAAGQADPSNADYQSFIAQNKAFVATLYANLLGRDDAKTADAEGIDFWANALATGMSRGDLISAFVSAALSDPNSDDAQTLNAKLSVADAYTAAFKDFGKDVTADEKKAAYAQLVEQMKEVVAGSTVEEFQDAINQFKGQNQDRKTDVFTKGEDDLDASESTAATTFRGTINISDVKKSTIQAGDAATGNSDFAAANTLIVDVKSDGKEKDFNFDRDMKATINNVDNLTINNGTADVTLNLASGDNYTGKVAITGKGDTANVTVAQDVESLNVSTSGAKKAYTDVTVSKDSTLGAFEGSAAQDTLKINGIIAKSINTGDGADSVTLDTNAEVYEKATINLGSGADEIIINTNKIGLKDANGDAITEVVPSVTIDGGNGKDTLTLKSDISTGVKSIVNVENIKATTTQAAISAVAADGLKTTVSGNLTINASYDNIKSIDLRGIKSEKDTDGKADTGFLKLSGVTYENITLSSNIEETIVFNSHNAEETSYAEISKFASGDKIQVSGKSLKTTELDGKKVNLTRANDEVKAAINKAGTDVVAINDTNGKASYIWQKVDVDNYKLVSIVDKKLKVDGVTNSFVYDNGKGDDEPKGSNQAIKFVSTATDLDLKATDGKVTYDTQEFNAPLGANDVLFVDAVKSAGLTVKDTTAAGSTKSTGKVAVVLTDNKAVTKDSTFGGKLDIYLGGSVKTTKDATGNVTDAGTQSGRADLGASGSEITAANLAGADKIYANTIGTIYLDNATNLAGKTIDLSIVKATIDLSKTALAADNKVIDVNKYVTGVRYDDTVIFKAAETQADTIINGSAGADNITLQAASGALTVDLGGSSQYPFVQDKLNVSAAKIKDGNVSEVVTVQNIAYGSQIILGTAGTADLKLKNADVEWKTDLKTTLAQAITGASQNDVFAVNVTNATKESDNGLYLVADLDTAKTLGQNDIVVKLVGVNDVAALTDAASGKIYGFSITA